MWLLFLFPLCAHNHSGIDILCCAFFTLSVHFTLKDSLTIVKGIWDNNIVKVLFRRVHSTCQAKKRSTVFFQGANNTPQFQQNYIFFTRFSFRLHREMWILLSCALNDNFSLQLFWKNCLPVTQSFQECKMLWISRTNPSAFPTEVSCAMWAKSFLHGKCISTYVLTFRPANGSVSENRRSRDWPQILTQWVTTFGKGTLLERATTPQT